MTASQALSAIVERGAHAFIVLGPPGFQAECGHGHQWVSPIFHGKHQARAAMQAHDAEQHAGQCWNGFCVLTGCDGINHTDTTGHAWQQARGTVYCPACQSYAHGGPLAADGCPNRYPAPVFTDYERADRIGG